MRLLSAGLAFFLLVLAATAASGREEAQRTVAVVAPDRLTVSSPAGSGQLPLYRSLDWTRPQPGVRRAVVVVHGIARNADVYYDNARAALAAAGPAGDGTMLIAPQFLAQPDLAAHHLSPDTLAWDRESWSGGAPALTPSPVSSFEAIDAILMRLADRMLFPDLRTVVIAGHSGGGQVVQRYAVVGKGEALAGDLHVRYVVANPSSYLYFTAERPGPDGGFAAFADAACPQFNDWKYGFAHGMPPYVDGSPEALEARYAARDVIYLLGTADTDPNHPVLDRSCMGEAEGPNRFARGHAYVAQLRMRTGPRLRHRLFDIAGVGHDNGRMFGSACGLYALFDRAGCAAP